MSLNTWVSMKPLLLFVLHSALCGSTAPPVATHGNYRLTDLCVYLIVCLSTEWRKNYLTDLYEIWWRGVAQHSQHSGADLRHGKVINYVFVRYQDELLYLFQIVVPYISMHLVSRTQGTSRTFLLQSLEKGWGTSGPRSNWKKKWKKSRPQKNCERLWLSG